MGVRRRPIEGFPGYTVTDTGEVWSTAKKWPGGPRQVFGFVTKEKYRRVSLWRDRKGYSRSVHHLVLDAFVGPMPEGMQCCHWDGNPLNNRLENLRWGSAFDNHSDKVRHGTGSAGEKNGNSKLNLWQVRVIRRLKGKMTQLRIGQIFGVSGVTISEILSGRKWRQSYVDLRKAG